MFQKDEEKDAQKLRRITATKYPVIKQMDNMAHNLRIKFNCSVCVDADRWYYKNSGGLHIGHKFSIFLCHANELVSCENWEELNFKYQQLMKRE